MYSQEVYDAATQAIRGAVSSISLTQIVRNEVSNVVSIAIREAIYSGTFDEAIKQGILEAAQTGAFDEAIKAATMKVKERESDAGG